MFPQGEREERNQREGGKEVKEVGREGEERRKESEREADSVLYSVFFKSSKDTSAATVITPLCFLQSEGPGALGAHISHPLPGVYPETIHSTNRMEGLTSQPPYLKVPSCPQPRRRHSFQSHGEQQ